MSGAGWVRSECACDHVGNRMDFPIDPFDRRPVLRAESAARQSAHLHQTRAVKAGGDRARHFVWLVYYDGRTGEVDQRAGL